MKEGYQGVLKGIIKARRVYFILNLGFLQIYGLRPTQYKSEHRYGRYVRHTPGHAVEYSKHTYSLSTEVSVSKPFPVSPLRCCASRDYGLQK